MRTNLPVTNREVRLADGKTIVSTTDLKGRITYANPYFVEISGFTLDELVGAPQNIVRHPDMPSEAFADLWRTIRAGEPWTALVKNRCKNGDFYWVRANVTPMFERGEAVGYLSVRTKPAAEEVAAAEALYARLRGADGGLRLARGKPARTGWRGRLDGWMRFGLGARTSLMCGALLAVAALQAADAGGGWRMLLAAVPAVVAVLMWLTVRHGILAPLRRATRLGMRLAGGDLTAQREAAADDEVGALLAALTQVGINLQSVIGDIRANFEQMQLATSEIARGNMDLSGRTESQASSLEQTAASMEELSRSVADNSQALTRAGALSGHAAQATERGSASVDQMLASMDAVTASSRQVLDIVGIIETIAFQTNILALNAAVEAARAGEQGRGFAVVASEVRNLAGRCSASAKDVAQLVQASIGNVDAGVRTSQAVGEQVREIAAAIGDVKQVMDGISVAAGEQAHGIAQVNAAVAHLDGLTQQNAALVEEAAAATASVVDQAGAIADALAMFKVAGAARPGARHAAPSRAERGRTGARKELLTGSAGRS
ncbi:methyl-accepting chemotaxis protein [Massilia rhizosphaerae]|uniref:methyl-accepting chemotaxis protein n=1 Tax=Massilia rhizosphaerae TaxID=2784389 RepID=UPI0018DD6550|nr:PAS domain-containing methyl-accepting chemotaxis protein [Massilia rhizosphaerae]